MARAFRNAAGAALALAVSACGGAVTSGVAVAEVGENISTHTDSVPQGAEVCAIKEALVAQNTTGREKRAWSEECTKALKKDHLWRRSMIVLAAHSASLEALAEGEDDNPGQVQAALTNVKGKDWIEAEEGDTPARDAVATLVDQMSKYNDDTELEQAIKDSAKPVKTICDGLNAYLEQQANDLADLQKEIEKKRESRTEKRCGTLDNRSLCVNDAPTDRVIYANAMGQLAVLQHSHAEARDDVAGFCAAHKKLEEAAANGTLDDDATYAAIVQAVKNARHGPAPIEAAPSEEKPGGEKGSDKAPEPKASSPEAAPKK